MWLFCLLPQRAASFYRFRCSPQTPGPPCAKATPHKFDWPSELVSTLFIRVGSGYTHDPSSIGAGRSKITQNHGSFVSYFLQGGEVFRCALFATPSISYFCWGSVNCTWTVTPVPEILSISECNSMNSFNWASAISKRVMSSATSVWSWSYLSKMCKNRVMFAFITPRFLLRIPISVSGFMWFWMSSRKLVCLSKNEPFYGNMSNETIP